jgi:hypothetical protein
MTFLSRPEYLEFTGIVEWFELALSWVACHSIKLWWEPHTSPHKRPDGAAAVH